MRRTSGARREFRFRSNMNENQCLGNEKWRTKTSEFKSYKSYSTDRGIHSLCGTRSIISFLSPAQIAVSSTLSTFSQDCAFLRLEGVPAASIIFSIKTGVECCIRLLVGKRKDADCKFLVVITEYVLNYNGDRGSTVVKVLCYKSVGRCFDPSWCHWKFSLT